MDEAMELLLRSLDTPVPVLTAEEMGRWPPGAKEALERLGLLRQAANASHAPCPSCESRHVEEVVVCEDGDGATRFYITCPESLREQIAEEDLRQWTFDWPNLARLAACELNLRGKVEALIPDRVWRLGRQTCDGLSREFLLGRGLLWPDGAALQPSLMGGAKRIVLVMNAPSPQWWIGEPPAVVRLDAVASWAAPWDLLAVADAIRRADRRDAAAGALDVSAKKEKVLRQAVRRALSHEQFDQLVAQEYRRQPSYTKVTAAIEARGIKTNRSAVGRAMKRMGGPGAVLRLDESRFEKPVSSHKRDRPKKS